MLYIELTSTIRRNKHHFEYKQILRVLETPALEAWATVHAINNSFKDSVDNESTPTSALFDFKSSRHAGTAEQWRVCWAEDKLHRESGISSRNAFGHDSTE